MAANNYFGFPHGGTQYAATGAAAYPAPQTAYAVAPAAAASYTAQRAAPAYETAYQAAAATPATYAVPGAAAAAATTYDYTGYARTAQQTAYEATKTYYQPQAPAPAPAAYTSTDYQGAKPQYSATYTTQATRPGVPVGVAQAAQKASAYSTTTYPAQQASNAYASAYTPASQVQPKIVQAKKTFNSGGYGGGQSSYTTGNTTATPNSYSQSYVTATTAPAPVQAQVVSKPKTGGTAASAYAGYDAALYSAASIYVAAAAQTTGSVGGGAGGGVTTVGAPAKRTNWQNFKRPGGPAGSGGTGGGYRHNNYRNFKQSPAPQQLHYCETCKICCAGPQTYEEHLGGKKHKKKEAMAKAGTPVHRAAGVAMHCELCEVTCTGSDAYSAHIRGSKHQKVLNLHTRLGKPIPSTDTVAAAAAADASKAPSAAVSSNVTTPSGVVKKTVTVAPKVNFIASGSLGSVKPLGGVIPPLSSSGGANKVAAVAGVAKTTATGKEQDKLEDVEMTSSEQQPPQQNQQQNRKEVLPIGEEYIEAIKTETGKTVQMTFNCKLCDCKFNDLSAKEMHLKGRRHRLAYKVKVDPNLVVEQKAYNRSPYVRRIMEEREQETAMREEFFRRREEERASFWTDRMMEVEERLYWEERRRYEEELEYYEWCRHHVPHHGRMMGPPPPPPPPMPPMFSPMGPPLHQAVPAAPRSVIPPRPDTKEDRHVILRHTMIYPKEPELRAVQKAVSHTEKALKFVSDYLADEASKSALKPAVVAPTVAGAKPGAVVAVKPGMAPAGIIKPGPGAIARPGTAPAALKPGVKPVIGPAKPAVVSPTKPGVPTPTVQAKAGPVKPGFTPAGKAAAAVVPPSAAPGGPLSAKQAQSRPLKGEPPKKEDGRDGTLFSFKQAKDEGGPERVLKGVMRVGMLAKGLLLSGDTRVELVALCCEKTTRSLLATIATNLPIQLKAVAPEENYAVEVKVEEAALCVISSSEPNITVHVTITSPVIREILITNEGSGDGITVAPTAKDTPDLLSKQKCLDALAALRHAKWFQAKASGLPSCVMVLRIFRDLCQRNPTWAPLNSWALELLVEKCISTGGGPMSPGDGVRRVMEALASGLLLPGGPGLLDPCEKDPMDAAANLSAQEREDITASAQHALRMIALYQIHKVLGIDRIPQKFYYGHRPHYNYSRKRRRDISSGEGTESEAGDGKKDKKDTNVEAANVKMEN